MKTEQQTIRIVRTKADAIMCRNAGENVLCVEEAAEALLAFGGGEAEDADRG